MPNSDVGKEYMIEQIEVSSSTHSICQLPSLIHYKLTSLCMHAMKQRDMANGTNLAGLAAPGELGGTGMFDAAYCHKRAPAK
jgi:hypothetical protein